jgi:hypothetical protein
MPLIKLPIPTLFSRSSDETSLTDQAGARLVNAWVEKGSGRPVIRKAPGLIVSYDFDTGYPIDGVFWWDAKSVYIIVSNGNIYVKRTLAGAPTSITGDALATVGPTTFACNNYQALLASGGRIVSIGVENLPDTTPTLSQGSTPANVANVEFDYYIGQTKYTKAAVAAGTAPGNDEIPQGRYGAVAFDISTAGAITATEATNNILGYDTPEQAIADLPLCASTKARMGVVTAMMRGAVFRFGTDSLSDASATVAYTSYLRNSECGIQATRFISDTNAPTTVSHVAWFDGYFLANDVGSAQFYWSGADEPFTWDSLDFASAEGNPDHINALHVAWLEITLFGKQTLETYYDDGSSPFARIDGGVLERGCLAPYSIVNAGGTWIWLDNERHLISLSGRNWKNLSGPYDEEISDMPDASSAIGVYFNYSGHDFYALTFPASKRTFVLNMTTDSWSEWGSWTSDTATFGMWEGGGCYAYSPTWDLHLFGSPSDSILYRAEQDYFLEDQANIRSLMRLAHVTHGTTARKRSKRLRINVKRGQGAVGGAEPVFTLRHNTDNRGWSNEVQVGLGLVGEYQHIIELRGLGTYHSRQWEIVHSDNSDFILNEVEEDAENLEE